MQSPDINADIPTPLTSQLLILTKDWLSIATFGLVFSDIERKSSLLAYTECKMEIVKYS